MIDTRSLITPHLIRNKNFYVAYSGGVDSTVLLKEVCEAAKKVNCNVTAIHINHGYSKFSDNWEQHCEKFCIEHDYPLQKFSLNIAEAEGASLESAMREKRYEIFQSLIGENDTLFMGHHLDDQIETLFFRILRGSGLKGSSSIPFKRNLGKGLLVRPFLNLSKKEIYEIAKLKKLKFIEDESNKDIKFDRNFLRNEVIEKISERWPNYRKSLSKYIENQKSSHEFLKEITTIELKKILHGKNIDVNKLKKYDSKYQKILILQWLEMNNCNSPSSSALDELTKFFVSSEKTKEPKFIWGSKEKGNYICLKIKKGIISIESNP